MTTQSETPRTDAFKRLAAESGLCGEEENHQTILFARTLERELAAVKEQLAEARRDADRFDWIISKLADGESIEFDPKWMHPLTSRENKKSGLITAIDTEIAAMKETK